MLSFLTEYGATCLLFSPTLPALPIPLIIFGPAIVISSIKTLLLLLVLALPCIAQEIKIHQTSDQDILEYLKIDRNSVAYTNFSVLLPKKMYGALEFRKSTVGKLPEINLLPLGPASEFTIKVFLGQVDPTTRTRLFSHKFSANGITVSGQHVIFLGDPISLPIEYSIGPTLPVVFTYNTASTTHTISFVSSNTPFKE